MDDERRYPDAAFSHATAALLWGAPLPLHLERDSTVDVSVRAPRRAPHAAGVRGHRIPARLDDLAWRSGVRVTTPGWTWLDLGAHLDLPDLVAVGDYLIHRDLPLTSRAELGRLLDTVPRSHGGSRLRRALALLSDAAESRPESLLRVAIGLGGLPDARVNRTMVRTDTGRDVRTDLSWPGPRVVVEYQGDYHRAAAQWRSDMRRRSALEADGWTVIEANWDDVLDPEPLVSRLRRLLRPEPLPD